MGKVVSYLAIGDSSGKTTGNVTFDKDVTTNFTIGQYNGTLATAVTIPTNGLTIDEAWDLIFSQEALPTVVQPSCTFAFNVDWEQETGTIIDSPSFTLTFSPGSYSYGPATGCTMVTCKALFAGRAIQDVTSGTFTGYSITVKDGQTGANQTLWYYEYTEGAIPVSNKGTEHPELRISAGYLGAKAYFNGYRKIFWGYANTASPTSAEIRALINSKKNAALTDELLAENPSASTIIIAAPTGTRSLTRVTMPSSAEADVTSAFVKQASTVQVNGANDTLPTAYDVWIYAPATMNGTYKINMA